MLAVARRVRTLAGKKLGIDIKDRVQVESAHIEHIRDRYFAEINGLNRRTGIHVHQAVL